MKRIPLSGIVLMLLMVSVGEAAVRTASSAPVHECDRLAAHPLDKDKVTEGVEIGQIDPGAARRACERAVSAYPNVARFAFQLGRAFYKANMFDEAAKYYRRAATGGHARAMLIVGQLYQKGRLGVPHDDVQAVKWFRRAADKNEVLAMYELGVMYKRGRGVEKNYAEAHNWHRKATEQGNADAMNSLANMYLIGQGTVQDYRKAARWFAEAVDKGNTNAMYGLGFMYAQGLFDAKGVGVRKDSEKAADLLVRAIQQGNVFAVQQLLNHPERWDADFHRAFQRRMRRVGVYDGAIDGKFGPRVKQAIKAMTGKRRPKTPPTPQTPADLGLRKLEELEKLR